MDDFQIVPEAEVATLAILGPRAAAALADVGVPVPPTMLESPLFDHLDVTSEAFGPLWIAHGRACGTDGLCVVASRSAREALVAALLAKGTPRLEPGIAEALRISALEPKPGSESFPNDFPSRSAWAPPSITARAATSARKPSCACAIAESSASAWCCCVCPAKTYRRQATRSQPRSNPPPARSPAWVCLPGELPVALAIVASAVPVGATVQIQHAEARLAAEVVAESVPWGKSR
jgi:hypothetical protein